MPPLVTISYLIITEMVINIASCTQSQNNGGLLFYLKLSEKSGMVAHAYRVRYQPGQYTMTLSEIRRF